MASLSYTIKATDSAGKGDGVIGITSVSVSESVGSGASRTLSVTVKGKRLDSSYSLNSPYCTGSSSLSSFSSGISGTLGGSELTFCTFKVTVSADESGNATLGSNYYIDVGGSSTSAGARSIKVTFNSASNLTPYTPYYRITIYKADNSSVLTYEDMPKNVSWDISYYLTDPNTQKADSSSKTSFKITGNPNGGYFATGTTSELSAQKEVITSYELKGWSTTKNSSTATYTETVTATSKDLDLYPVYTSTVGNPIYTNNVISALSNPSRSDSPQGSYSVTYNANGGSVSTSSSSAAITRSYTFKGWAATENATSADAQTSYTAETTVYAYWTYKDSTASVTLPTPTRTGYTFVGWAESTSATSGVTGQYQPTKSVTLYAIWSADGSVKIYDEASEQFKTALVWVYHNGAWRNTIPWAYKDGSWKICGG